MTSYFSLHLGPVDSFYCCANWYGSFGYSLFLPFLNSFSANELVGNSYGNVDFIFCCFYAYSDSFPFSAARICICCQYITK